MLWVYLEAAAGDAAYRWSVLGPKSIDWDGVDEAQRQFKDLACDVIARAVKAQYVRPDFDFLDFVMVTRAVMANMSNTAPDNWHRILDLIETGIRREVISCP